MEMTVTVILSYLTAELRGNVLNNMIVEREDGEKKS